MLNWDAYQNTVETAEKSGNDALVDLAANRALKAMLADREPARVAVRGLARDLARDNPTVSLDDRYDHIGMVNVELTRIPGPEDALMKTETESEFWASLSSKTRRLRVDCRDTVLAVARLLSDGYNGSECAATLGISEMSVSRARSKLATLLA